MNQLDPTIKENQEKEKEKEKEEEEEEEREQLLLAHEVISYGLDPGGDLPRVCVAHGHAVMAPFVLWPVHGVVENEIRRAHGR